LDLYIDGWGLGLEFGLGTSKNNLLKRRIYDRRRIEVVIII
jgi:hypothetical protein